MKLQIDTLSSVTGWTVNSPSTISANSIKEYIAGFNSSSLLIKFSENDSVKTAEKTFTAIDVTDYESLVFSVWSQQKGINQAYTKPADFSYKITLNDTQEFYFQVYDTFTDVTIGIEDVTSISKIKITALHTDTDYLIISEMIAEKEEVPLDILLATKEHIDYYMARSFYLSSNGLLIGTLSAVEDDVSVSINNPIFLDRYGVIKIDDGVNSETHQIEDNDGQTFQLNANFDGPEILNDYTAANVYLQFPCLINPQQDEIRLPGVSIWGIVPEFILRGGKLDIIRDSFSVDGTSKERVEGQIQNYKILIDCESRSQELINIMTSVVRQFIAREFMWINGRRHDIYFDGSPVENIPGNGIDYIPRVQYSISIEVKENINQRQSVAATTTINFDAEPQEA